MDLKIKTQSKLKWKILCILIHYLKIKFLYKRFVKNCVACKIAISDGKCILGFTGSLGKLYPNTLLNNNHLDEAKCIL